MVQTVGAEDARAASTVCRQALSGLVDLDWSVRAGDLDWSCRRTLEHIQAAPIDYASELASGTTERPPRARDGRDWLTILDLLLSVRVNSAVLEHVLRAAPASARAFHEVAVVDPSGFAAMGCDEILIHTADISTGFGTDFQPPEDLVGPCPRAAVSVGADRRWTLGVSAVGERAHCTA